MFIDIVEAETILKSFSDPLRRLTQHEFCICYRILHFFPVLKKTYESGIIDIKFAIDIQKTNFIWFV